MYNKDKYPVLIAGKLDKKSINSSHIFLFNSKTNRGYQVEGLAALFIYQFDGQRSVATLLDELEQKYNIEKGKFDSEVDAVIEDLLKFELIELRDNASS